MPLDGDSDAETSALIETLAAEILHNFELIADAARVRLGQRGVTFDAMASINQATAEKLQRNLRDREVGREIDCRRLIREPATARLVIADKDDNREILYVSAAGTVDPLPFNFCSYLSPKGRLASSRVGTYQTIRLPEGDRDYELLEKTSFSPLRVEGEWDSRPAIIYRETGAPLTIKSLRELLTDELERQLQEDDVRQNTVSGLRRSVLTAMQMRVEPLLDQYQDEIFRLPLDSRLAVLGPPGSGKTTTLIKRLRQKLDFNFLEPEEIALVREPAANNLDHAHSWLMFTPTTLLKEYVKAAFSKEDVPVPEGRIQTWEDYRHAIARRSLSILRSGKRRGMVVRPDVGILQSETISNQVKWFEAFSDFQQGLFLTELRGAASLLAVSEDPKVAAIGQQITVAIDKNDGWLDQILFELAALLEDVQDRFSVSRDAVRKSLKSMLSVEVRKDKQLLDALADFLSTLTPENDDLDDPDGEDDDEDPVPQQGRRAAEAAFYKALRAKALTEITKRAPSTTSRNARVLLWLEDRGISLPLLADIGSTIVVQRAMSRISRAPTNYIVKIPARYRRFRRQAYVEGKWYASLPAASDIVPMELDIVVLAMLRAARQMASDGRLMGRLGERAPTIVGTMADLYRNQILVDEATDFSPIQLACMAALVSPRTKSFFAIGDFNQRLTRWGLRSKSELRWLFHDIDIREVEIVYRQSRKLNEFANCLLAFGEGERRSILPEFMENEGVAPVLGIGLSKVEQVSQWLASRIQEIEHFSEELPSIAVLVNQESELQPLADALNEALAGQTIRAAAYPKGQNVGEKMDVRIFEVQHIKGLEFEAIFFVDIDVLARSQTELFDRYIYVGATRAATFLGLTCSGDSLPDTLQPVADFFQEKW